MNNVPQYIKDQGDEGVSDFISRFPIFKTPYDVAFVLSDNAHKKSSGQSVIPDGTIVLDSQTKKYKGYFGGNVVTVGDSVEKVIDRLSARFDVVEFFGENK